MTQPGMLDKRTGIYAELPEAWQIPLSPDGVLEVWARIGSPQGDGRSWYSCWRRADGPIAGEFGPYLTPAEAVRAAVLDWSNSWSRHPAARPLGTRLAF